MTGAIVAPEMTRDNKKGSHVFPQRRASSAILSERRSSADRRAPRPHEVKSTEVSQIVLSTSGVFGVLCSS